LRNTIGEGKEMLNIDDLSNCTDENIEEEINYRETMRKTQRGNKDNNDHLTKVSDMNRKINISCIFKSGDDLRQDSLALQVIHIFREIFRENNLKLFVYPYQTISTISTAHNDLGGFIECCQDCDSRDQIGKTYDTNLYDYFVCCFGHENSNEFRQARKNFIESLAAYAIISYILQIKDRHNGNILIDKYGHIIHIDFGFIFDISPANNMKFEKAAFKLTKEMLKIMGSTNSESYAAFVDLTIRGFLACRDYMDKLLDPVVLMFNSGLECFRADSIKNFIDRFKLELTEDEAAIYMKNLIRQSEDNWRTNFYDYLQKRQNNIYY
jgi:phosphatidylinositol 4-kinase